jgi:hypothetical protein
MKIKSDRKEIEGGWNCTEKNLILKIISNKTNSNKKNKDQMIDKKKFGGWNWKKTNFINYFK